MKINVLITVKNIFDRGMHSLQVYANSSLFMYLQTLSHAWKQRYESHPTTICTFSSEKKKKKNISSSNLFN